MALEFRRLGHSGLKVSSLALGTMTFGKESDEAAAREILAVALDAGVNFVDTANTYADGASETLLGKLLHGRRHELVLATKFANPTGKGPNEKGTSRLHILNAVHDSLKRLQTDYIDLYYVHHLDPDTPAEETLATLDTLVRQGKVRYIACSNFEAWRLMDSLWTSRTRGFERYIAHQAHYNLLVRDIEDEIVEVARREHVGVVAWGPLASGVLTGKHGVVDSGPPGAGARAGASRYANRLPYFAPNTAEVVRTLLARAQEIGRPPGAVALQWLLSKPAVASVIIGARTREQAEQNLVDALEPVPQAVLAEMDALSTPPGRYPKAFELARGR
jgi:aryl-alcohol dehydrogenase-like predicted oxidoreductase